MDILFQKQKRAILGLTAFMVLSGSVSAFELLSEGAMGSVSAVSANSAEDIVSVIGSTAAGLTVDDDYDELPFQVSASVQGVVMGGYEVDEAQSELEFALTQEVEGWVNSLTDKQGSGAEVSYVDELPSSRFEDNAEFIIQDVEFESVIFDSNLNDNSNTLYEIGRVDQTITVISSGVDSIQYIVERRLERAATIDSFRLDDDTPSLGSGYISDLTSISNVTIAQVRK
ncbi:MAG: hypothetical protein ACJASG_000479 [Oleiphilaceae bacterium]|jgi:hypothetical protein